MSRSEFPAAEPEVGVNSPSDLSRSKHLIYHNSRILCWLTMSLSIVGAFLAVFMMILVVSLFYPTSSLRLGKISHILGWTIGTISMAGMCAWLWSLSRAMAYYRVLLDGRGITFSLGTRKKPEDIFLPWDRIVAIRQKRVGNARVYSVLGSDGSEFAFSSYTFFRPRKVARLICERTGLAIQKSNQADTKSFNPESGR